jgi:hypothetical protein
MHPTKSEFILEGVTGGEVIMYRAEVVPVGVGLPNHAPGVKPDA